MMLTALAAGSLLGADWGAAIAVATHRDGSATLTDTILSVVLGLACAGALSAFVLARRHDT